MLSGASRYFTGKPCKWGHVSERTTIGSGCVECKHVDTKKRRSNGYVSPWEKEHGKEYQKKYGKEWNAAKTQDYKDRKNEQVKKSRAKARSLKYAGIPDRPLICEVCNNPETSKGPKGDIKFLALDHDHVTGKFRGWLCQCCNMALGNARDNPKLLRDLADYLEKNTKL